MHPHVEVKVVDPETGRIVPRGEPGELCTRGYSVMLGYWDDPERTAEAIDRGRWMHTGDLAVMDDEGYLKIVGRSKDMVIRGGENVYPREIEEFLYTHPDVADVQVIGVPDARYGEELMAWIVPRAARELDQEAIAEFCRGKIAHFKVPRYVQCVDEFPMTVTGKVQKFKLRERAIEELGLREGRRHRDGLRPRRIRGRMCGRYTLTEVDPTRSRRASGTSTSTGRPETLGRFNVCPTETIAVDRAEGPRAVRWGLGPFRKRSAGPALINARVGDGRDKAPFASSWRGRAALPRARRRLVRVAEAREPKGARGSRSATRSTAARRSRSPGCGAGRRSTGGSPRRRSSPAPANGVCRPVHDRMPCVLAGPEAEAAWLPPRSTCRPRSTC